MGSLANSVKNNMTARFTDRSINISKNARTKSTEKLASGYRVNRSADDAAGLSISEQTRRLVRGLGKGCENIKEGISLVKTAEGALNEVEDMLQRMNELTVRGLTGTMSNQDRRYIQEEIDRLYDEIVRVADTTEFNEMPVLQGNPTKLLTREVDPPRIDKVPVPTPATGLPSSITVNGTALTPGTSQKTVLMGTLGVSVINNNSVTQPSGVDTAWTTINGSNQSKDNWSSTLADNYGLYLDFSGFASITGTEEDGTPKIYTELEKMIGNGFYTTCNTCSTRYQVGFYKGDVSDYNFGSYDRTTAKVNLDSLLTKAADPTADPAEIAKELVTKVADAAKSKMSSHYSRVATTDSDPYKLFVYDFRDDSSHDQGYINRNNLQGKIGSIEGTITVYRFDEITSEQYYGKAALNIQHSADAPDNTQINLPELKKIFDIYSSYGYATIKDSLTLQKYIPAHDEQDDPVEVPTGNIIHHPAESGETPIYETEVYYENGERRTRQVKVGTKPWSKEAWDEEEKVTVPGEIHHIPDWYGDLNYPMIDVLKDLIGQVSKLRVDLGAQQNQLEHSLRENEVAKEEHTANETKQRDLDVPAEMVNFSCRNIASQAGESIMAQSSKINNTVLKMLP